jgi:hypothetical protein
MVPGSNERMDVGQFWNWNVKKIMWVLFALSFACVLTLPAAARTSGPAEFLRKIDRQLCVNFKSLKCKYRKQRIAEARKVKSKTEKPAKPSKASETKVATVLPRFKPLQAPKPEASLTPVVLRKTPEKPPVPITPEKPLSGSCLSALKALGVDFDSVPQPAGQASCKVQQPVQLKSVRMRGVNLQLPDRPILNCAFARRFVSWLKEAGGPAATATQGFAMTEFYTGPGYQCRGRNGDASAKISEHGYGNAIDVERIKFSDGQVFLVHDALDPSAKAYKTLKAIRKSACARFTTVLGPGTNAAHREHFHFDAGMHGKSATYKICE